MTGAQENHEPRRLLRTPERSAACLAPSVLPVRLRGSGCRPTCDVTARRPNRSAAPGGAGRATRRAPPARTRGCSPRSRCPPPRASACAGMVMCCEKSAAGANCPTSTRAGEDPDLGRRVEILQRRLAGDVERDVAADRANPQAGLLRHPTPRERRRRVVFRLVPAIDVAEHDVAAGLQVELFERDVDTPARSVRRRCADPERQVPAAGQRAGRERRCGGKRSPARCPRSRRRGRRARASTGRAPRRPPAGRRG